MEDTLDKFDKYQESRTELEKSALYKILFKKKKDRDILKVKRQDIKIALFYLAITIILVFALAELTYNLFIIRKASIYNFRLCQNIPNECF